MRKIFTFISFVLLLSTSFDVKANPELSFEYLKNDNDYNDIKEIETYIEGSLRHIIEIENGSVNDTFSIDIGDSLKVNHGFNLLEAKSNNIEEVNRTFEKDSYVWVYTTLYGDQYCQITLGKGLPPNGDVDLTEEEYTWVKQREGKWTISSISILEENKAYDEMVQEKIYTNELSGEKVYLLALAFNDLPIPSFIRSDSLNNFFFF